MKFRSIYATTGVLAAALMGGALIWGFTDVLSWKDADTKAAGRSSAESSTLADKNGENKEVLLGKLLTFTTRVGSNGAPQVSVKVMPELCEVKKVGLSQYFTIRATVNKAPLSMTHDMCVPALTAPEIQDDVAVIWQNKSIADELGGLEALTTEVKFVDAATGQKRTLQAVAASLCPAEQRCKASLNVLEVLPFSSPKIWLEVPGHDIVALSQDGSSVAKSVTQDDDPPPEDAAEEASAAASTEDGPNFEFSMVKDQQ